MCGNLPSNDFCHLCGKNGGHAVVMAERTFTFEAWAASDVMADNDMALSNRTCEDGFGTPEDGDRGYS